MENWAKIFRTKCPKTRSNHVWILLGTILDIFGSLTFFKLFWKFSKSRTSMEHWAKKIFEKTSPKTCSKHVWILLGTILGIFGILKFFWFFWKFLQTRPSMEHWAEVFRKNCPKTRSELVWILLGTILGIFGILNFFWFFLKNFEDSTFHGKLGEIVSEKLPQNMFKTLLDSFGNGFVRFWWEFWKFFDFFRKLSKTRPSMEHWAKIFWKNWPQNKF